MNFWNQVIRDVGIDVWHGIEEDNAAEGNGAQQALSQWLYSFFFVTAEIEARNKSNAYPVWGELLI